MKRKLLLSVFMSALLCCLGTTEIFAQAACGETAGTLMPDAGASMDGTPGIDNSLCTDGSDAGFYTLPLGGPGDNGGLPDYGYVIEINGVLTIYDGGDPTAPGGPLDPAGLNVGDVAGVAGIAFDIAAIQGIIDDVNGFCGIVPGTINDLIAPVTCDDLAALPPLNTLQDIILVAETFGGPLSSINQAIEAILSVEAAIASSPINLGEVCFAVSDWATNGTATNNGDDTFTVDYTPSYSIEVVECAEPDCDGVVGGTALPGTACDDGDATTGDDVWDDDCVCAGMPLDCEGVAGGTALAGTACDDGDATTGDDVWGDDCVCAGLPLDCLGVAGGLNTPGSECDDLNTETGNDVWGTDCVCAGELLDCEGTPGGTAVIGTPCDDGDPTTGGDQYIDGCACVGLPLDCEGVAGGTDVPGAACDDGDATTGDDVYGTDCVCAGLPLDCLGVAGGTDVVGSTCDDGDATTENDVYGTDCVCAGTPLGEDCEGTPGGTVGEGDACDDDNPDTGNDVYDANCVCAGEVIDCAGTPGGTALPGTTCDDGLATTENDMYGTDCVCTGTPLDEDCEGTPGGTVGEGDACDDDNPDTENDVYDANCVCAGTPIPEVDCLGVPGGTDVIGSGCDDGDAATENDMYGTDCVCAGTPTAGGDDMLVINEVDYDQPSGDMGEFVELYNAGTTMADLSNYSLDLINGSTGSSYASASGFTGLLAPGDYYVVCFGANTSSYCDITVSGSLQNGGSSGADGIQLLDGATVVDGLSYDGDLAGVTEGSGVGLEDDSSGGVGGPNDAKSIYRSEDGLDTDMNNVDFIFGCNSPGAENGSVTDCEPLEEDCLGVPGGTAVVGSTCDDGDATTENDMYGTDCVCAGTPILEEDCLGVPGGTAIVGSTCDDGDAATTGDVYGADCVCAGTLLPEDCEGVPGGTAVAGSACDDGDATTENDVYGTDCLCAGTPIAVDCEGTPGGTAVVGSVCDDGDATTGGDVYGADCVCAGTTLATDCEGTVGGSVVPGSPCDDGDAATSGDAYDADCNCIGSAECPYLVTEVSPYQGNEGGVTPFYYNTVEITVSGGTAPYSLVNSDNTGYVRWAVIESSANQMTIRVIYADNGIYNFTVSDATDCETSVTNDPVAAGAVAQELDIYDYTVTSDNNTTLTSYEGGIDVFVEGGTAPYTFDWVGPVSFTAITGGAATGLAPATASYSLTGLRSGWYATTVTDAAGGTSEGWYWVSSNYDPGTGTDRGKVGQSILVDAQPNPFNGSTSIVFGVNETSKTRVAVYTIDGKEVAELFNGNVQGGVAQVTTFDAANLAAGMYFIKVDTDSGASQHHKLLLTK